VFNNKKPAFWIACAAVIIVAAGAVLLIANPRADDTAQWRPQPEYEDQDEYWKAIAEARESDRTKEIAVDDWATAKRPRRPGWKPGSACTRRCPGTIWRISRSGQ
jgi:hypothetical protein